MGWTEERGPVKGRNAKQVQRWLGHHSAAFTLETYIHLLSDELDAPLELPAETEGGNKGATKATEIARNDEAAERLREAV